MRKTLKLSLTVVFACLMLISVAIIASAESTPTDSGSMGLNANDNVNWAYYADTQTLVISGKGRMANFTPASTLPYWKYRSNITNLVIESGITRLGDNTCRLPNVEEIVIPDSVTAIGRYVFQGNTNLKKLVIGTGVTSIGNYTFSQVGKFDTYIKDLESWMGITFATYQSNPVAMASKKLYLDGELIEDLVIPEGVTEIKKYGFYANQGIKTVTIPSTITSIGYGAFNNCIYINTLTFDNCTFKSAYIAFRELNRLKTVNVNGFAGWAASNFTTYTNGHPLNAKGKPTLYADGFALTRAATNMVNFVVPDGTTKLTTNSLRYRSNMNAITIPASVTTIEGDLAKFKGPFTYSSNLTTIYGEAGSYAETYAKACGYKFVAITPVAVTGVTVDTDDTQLTVGSTLTATAAVAPADATFAAVIWTSSNPEVARVSGGVVTAVGAGEATITVKTSNGAFSDSFVVTVPAIPVTGVELNLETASVELGHTLTLVPTFTPADASNKAVTWKTSNKAVATVKNGIVTPVAGGTATITVTTVDGGKTATCVVTVEVDTVAVEGVALDAAGAVLEIGETLQLNATVTPADATDASITWSSDNENVATVVDGLVTAKAEGKAIITVTTVDGGFTATCAVTVEPGTIAVESVVLDATAATLEIGETLQLNATVTPADATDASVTWSSDDEDVATVVDGLVTAKAAGTATITVTTVDGGKTATCTVTVPEPAPEDVPVEAISLGIEELEIVIGEEYTFDVIFTPDNTTETEVYWESTKSSVASISDDGVLKALSEGTTIITVISSANEDLYAECFVTVISGYPVESIALNKTNASMLVGDELTLSVTFTPANATNKNVIWSTNNDAVATVVDGVVTAVGSGVATITATSEDGEFTATCKVIVTTGNETPPIEWNN